MTAADSPAADDSGRAARSAANGVARLTLAVLGAGFAWFAYIDAPITDGVMWLFSSAVGAGFLSVIAALVGAEALRPSWSRHTRRAALLLFAVATALLLAAATLTLNLRGAGTDEADTPTVVILPV